MLIQELTRQDRISTRLESSSLDRVWIESAWRQEDLSLFSLFEFRSCLKVDSIDMLKFTHTHTHTHTQV